MKYPFDISKVTVLIADGYSPMRNSLRRLIVDLGIQHVIETDDGQEAIREINQQHIDLILCDTFLKKANGYTVLDHLRSKITAWDIPFIMVTSEGIKGDIVKARDLGVSDYILKPIQPIAVKEKIIKALTHYFSPSPLESKLREGDSFLRKNNLEKAILCYREAIALNKTHARTRHCLAHGLFLSGQIEEALKTIKVTLKQTPHFYKSYSLLVDIYMSKKDLPRAIEALKKEVSFNPKKFTRQILLAHMYLQRGQLSDAIHHYREALKEDNKQKEALLGIGEAFAQANNLDKALYYFQRVRRHYPTESLALNAAVKHSLAFSLPKRAEQFLREEKNKHQERTDVYLYLARLYKHLAHYEQAEQILKELLTHQASHKDALKSLVTIYIEWGKPKEGLDYCQKLLSIDNSRENNSLLSEILKLENK